jgi:hypothetical protein
VQLPVEIRHVTVYFVHLSDDEDVDSLERIHYRAIKRTGPNFPFLASYIAQVRVHTPVNQPSYLVKRDIWGYKYYRESQRPQSRARQSYVQQSLQIEKHSDLNNSSPIHVWAFLSILLIEMENRHMTNTM